MGKMLPEEFIEKVQHAVDIVDVVSEYVQLKKQGRNFFGLCPFHGENTPSFSVSPEKQIFHCFGCGSGGNVFTFLMQIEGCSFTEAVQMTAKKLVWTFQGLGTFSRVDIPKQQRSRENDKSA